MKKALEGKVWQRARAVCEYCRMPQEADDLPFQIDHVIARKHRGKTTASNLALSCCPCKNYKGPNLSGIDPETRQVVRLFNPRRHKWEQHFRWDGASLVGRTEIRRATVEVLEINLPHRLEFRDALIQAGRFPPF